MISPRADVDVFACLVLAVESDGKLPEGWRPGPLPVAIPTSAAHGRSGGDGVADRLARSSYFAPRVVETLYGTNPADRTGRWHVKSAGQQYEGARLEGWECLILADRHEGAGPSGYAVAHLQLIGDPMANLPELTRRTGAARAWLEGQLPAGLKRSGDPTVGVVSHLMYSGAQLPEPVEDKAAQEALRGWSSVDRWLWYTGSGVDPGSYLPDPQAPMPGTPVFLSADWRGLALRNGVAYCALTRGTGNPHGLLRSYVRSIHLDGYLLVQLQSDGAHALADELGRSRVSDLTVESAMGLEAQLLELRGGIWWRHVSSRGSQVDQVVKALQDERSLPELYEQLVAELTDTARFIELRKAREDQVRDRKVNQIVSLASAAFVTPSVFLAAVALVPEPSGSELAAFWGAAIALAVVTWVLVRSWLLRSEGVGGD